MPDLHIVRSGISREALKKIAAEGFGDMVKAVVDLERKIMAIGGEMHADEEQALLEDGSKRDNVWGINLYPDSAGDEFIEFDSMINIRPSRGNRSRGVDSLEIQRQIRGVVAMLTQ